MLAAPSGKGKTKILQEVRTRTDAPLVNINLELSRHMLELTEIQRAIQLPRILRDIIENFGNDLVLLDNIEMIFDIEMKQDPLRLLLGLSRNVTLVAAWNGTIADSYLTYSVPGHPEYRRYPIHDFIVVKPERTA